MTQSTVPGPNLGTVTIGGTVVEKQDQPASSTATWTSATAVNTALTNTTVSGYGTANVSIQTPSTATAGAITFEVSDDGTVWYPAGAVRVDNTLAENIVQIAGPGIAQTRMYAVSVDAMTQIRVRLSTVIAGTGNVVVRIGLVAGGIEPLVATVPPRTICSFTSQHALVVAETFASLTPTRGFTAGGASTTMTVTAGRTLRITSLTVTLQNTGTAAVNISDVFLRAKASGTIATTDPVMWRTRVGNQAAVVNTSGTLSAVFPDGLDLPSGAVFGISQSAVSTNGVLVVSLNGYEF